MTRKDFKLISEVVASLDDKGQRNYLGIEFASRLQKMNPRFDAGRFLVACKCEGK
jgi:hypothetical protein